MALPSPAWSGPPRGDPRVDVVVVGGSAGALQALEVLLPQLPPGWPLPVVVVVHTPRRGTSALAAVLGSRCALPVVAAEDKRPLTPGTVFVGIPDYHLLVDRGPALALSVDDPVRFSIPSIDVLFESAALTCGERVAGVVLSGASEDGADGLAAISAAGGVAVVQAPEDAVVETMPRAAIRRCPAARVAPAAEIAPLLRALWVGDR